MILSASRRAAQQNFLATDLFTAGARLLVPDESAPERERIGRYRLLDEIGRGGMGTVYLAEHEDFHQRVAIKIIKRGNGHGRDYSSL